MTTKTRGAADVETQLVKPRALKPKDRVSLLCPASRPHNPATIDFCKKMVEEMGFTPILGSHVLSMHGYMAGTDSERIADFNAAIHDDTISAIFCLTGGFGSLPILDKLDFAALAKKPKLIVGSDDNCHLLVAALTKIGLVSLHGPNLDHVSDRAAFDKLKNAVTSKAPLPKMKASNWLGDSGTCYAPVAGRVEGQLVGGNLTALVSLMGTPYHPDFNSRILFLEDKNERNDILDRWLTTLWVAGELDRVSGVAFGNFENCGTKGSENMLTIEELFGDRMMKVKKPSCFGLPFGQGPASEYVPYGCNAKFDAQAGVLEILESALV